MDRVIEMLMERPFQIWSRFGSFKRMMSEASHQNKVLESTRKHPLEKYGKISH